MQQIELVAGERECGERLDRALQSHLPDLSRTALQKLIDEGAATVNGKPARSGQRLRAGDIVRCEVTPPPPPASAPEVEAIPLDIVYEDQDVLVVNKPRGLVVHPAPGHRSGTLVNAVLGHTGGELPSENEEAAVFRHGIVHRLDKDTSGLMVVARSEPAMRSLQAQIAARSVERRYLALVWGNPRFESATVDAPIGRHPTDRKRMSVHAESSPHTHREARTDLTVLERFNGLTLLEARLHTGRTHQIRVHGAYIRLPIVGDETYGPRTPADTRLEPEIRDAVRGLEGQALHAHRLAFDHPATRERMTFQAAPPPDLRRVLNALGSTWSPSEDD
jgi:23S rRNA pseudouridine1911/1915/1917 synthase